MTLRKTHLTAARKARGWTALDIAEAIDSNENRIFSVERGRARVQPDEARRWARLLEMPLDDAFPELQERTVLPPHEVEL